MHDLPVASVCSYRIAKWRIGGHARTHACRVLTRKKKPAGIVNAQALFCHPCAQQHTFAHRIISSICDVLLVSLPHHFGCARMGELFHAKACRRSLPHAHTHTIHCLFLHLLSFLIHRGSKICILLQAVFSNRKSQTTKSPVTRDCHRNTVLVLNRDFEQFRMVWATWECSFLQAPNQIEGNVLFRIVSGENESALFGHS